MDRQHKMKYCKRWEKLRVEEVSFHCFSRKTSKSELPKPQADSLWGQGPQSCTRVPPLCATSMKGECGATVSLVCTGLQAISGLKPSFFLCICVPVCLPGGKCDTGEGCYGVMSSDSHYHVTDEKTMSRTLPRVTWLSQNLSLPNSRQKMMALLAGIRASPCLLSP